MVPPPCLGVTVEAAAEQGHVLLLERKAVQKAQFKKLGLVRPML